MAVRADTLRGRRAARLLHDLFSTVGIHGHTEMPEDIRPTSVAKGSLEHLLFITLTVAIDYQRDANSLWDSARRTFEDEQTRYLFHPRALHEAPPRKVREDMRKHRLSKKPRKDAHIWRTVGVTFYKKWQSDPRRFLAACGWDCLTVLQRLKGDTHLYNGREVTDFPYLRGDKIGPLWLRMLRDNVGVRGLAGLDRVPIPVDVHVARATMCLGVVSGEYSGPLEELFPTVRQAWHGIVDSLTVGDRSMVALDVDEPLWHLSKYGCSRRDKATGNCPARAACEMRDMCMPGRVCIERGRVEMRT